MSSQSSKCQPMVSLPENSCLLAHCAEMMSLIRALRDTHPELPQTPTVGLTSQARPQAVSRMGFAALTVHSPSRLTKETQAAPFRSYKASTYSSSFRDDSPLPQPTCGTDQEKRRELFVTVLGPFEVGKHAWQGSVM